MNCPRCGKPIAGGASFCMHCGQMLAGTAPRPAPQMTGSMPAYSPQVTAGAISDDVKRRNTILAIIISVGVILLALLGLNASGALRFGAKSPDRANLNAGAGPDRSILNSQGSGAKPTLEASRRTMPADLYNWLKHLEKCEKLKQALTGTESRDMMQIKSQLTGADGMTTPEDVNNMSDPDYNSFPSLDKVTAVINRFQPDWQDLKKTFDSVPPPEECKPIAEAFDNGLQSIVDLFGSVASTVEHVNLTDPNAIKSSADDVRKTGLHHVKSVDGEFQETDDLVQKICDKYETKKWFKIDAHGGTGGLFGY